MLGGNECHLMNALASNRHISQQQWLGVNVTIHRIGKESAETVGVDVRQRQIGFGKVLAGARKIVVVGQNGHRSRRGLGESRGGT